MNTIAHVPTASNHTLDFFNEIFRGATDGYLVLTEIPSPRVTKNYSFAFSEREKAAQWMQSRAQYSDVYVARGLQGVRPAGSARGDHKGISFVGGLFADIDTREGFHQGTPPNKLPVDTAEALALIEEAGLPEPTLVIHTGGGCHVHWLYETPPNLDTAEDRDAEKALSTAFEEQLRDVFDLRGYNLDKVCDLPRLCKAPQTWNHKKDPEKPDEPLKSVYVSQTGLRVERPDMLALVQKRIPPGMKQRSASSYAKGGRNNTLTSEGGRLRSRGFEKLEILAALIKMNEGFDPPLELSEVESVASSVSTYAPGPKTYSTNDHGLSLQFIDEYGENIRFIPDESSWILWDRNIWRRDQGGEVVRLFLNMAEDMLAKRSSILISPLLGEKEALAKAKLKDKAEGWARQAGEHRRITSALKLASSDPRVVVTPNMLDNLPGLLPVANGIIDLASSQLLPNAKSKLATKASPIEYDPKAKCPQWEAVIAGALPGELGPFVQRMLGYSLAGVPREQRFFLWVGKGADSKSLIARVVTHILGRLVTQPAAETFLATDNDKDGNSPRSDLIAFMGARLIIAGEPPSRRKLDEALLKRLTGGDKVNARPVYGRTKLEFDMSGTIILPTNHLPGADESDAAFWRRAVLVPFDRSLPEDDWDIMLFDKLVAKEAKGILAWLIRGALSYQEKGLDIPEIVRERTRLWRKSVGSIERFVNDRCVPGSEISLKELHGAYRVTCMAEQVHPLGLGKLGERLKQLGYTIEGAQAGEVVKGLRIRS